MNKAQTATEYLVILAIVVVIALIVIGVLGESIGIGGGAGSNTVNAQAQTGDIAIETIAVTQWGTTVQIRNNLAETITIDNMSIEGFDCASYVGGYNVYPSLPKTLKLGGKIKLTCPIARIEETSSSSGSPSEFYGTNPNTYISDIWNLESGSRTEVKVAFTYTNSNSGATYTTGNITMSTTALTGLTNYGYEYSAS